jgi:hypothetical protein
MAGDGMPAPPLHRIEPADLSPLPGRDHGCFLGDDGNARSRDEPEARTATCRRSKRGSEAARTRTGARNEDRGGRSRRNRRVVSMATRSQSAPPVGNRDASLSSLDAHGKRLGGGRENADLDSFSGTADPPRGHCDAGPGHGIGKSSSADRDHTRSRCSGPGYKGRKEIGGSPVVEVASPSRAWTCTTKLAILNPLGEQSTGPCAGGGERCQPEIAVSRVLFSPFFQPSLTHAPFYATKTCARARLRARR